jgi:hypothetical protein
VSEEQPTAPNGAPTGRPYQSQNEDVAPAPPRPNGSTDPDAYGSGLRQHWRLQNQLASLVTAAGFNPLSPRPGDPEYDLAWIDRTGITTVVEVKSITASNEIRQLRMGLGQALDYANLLARRGCTARPALYLQRQPTDNRWLQIADDAGVRIAWPGAEHQLGLDAGTRTA